MGVNWHVSWRTKVNTIKMHNENSESGGISGRSKGFKKLNTISIHGQVCCRLKGHPLQVRQKHDRGREFFL